MGLLPTCNTDGRIDDPETLRSGWTVASGVTDTGTVVDPRPANCRARTSAEPNKKTVKIPGKIRNPPPSPANPTPSQTPCNPAAVKNPEASVFHFRLGRKTLRPMK